MKNHPSCQWAELYIQLLPEMFSDMRTLVLLVADVQSIGWLSLEQINVNVKFVSLCMILDRKHPGNKGGYYFDHLS